MNKIGKINCSAKSFSLLSNVKMFAHSLKKASFTLFTVVIREIKCCASFLISEDITRECGLPKIYKFCYFQFFFLEIK